VLDGWSAEYNVRPFNLLVKIDEPSMIVAVGNTHRSASRIFSPKFSTVKQKISIEHKLSALQKTALQ
jgi:hypothetical protein